MAIEQDIHLLMTLHVPGITPHGNPLKLAEAVFIEYYDTYAVLADAYAEAMDDYKVETPGLELVERFNDAFDRAVNNTFNGGIHGIQLDDHGMMLRIIRTLAPAGEVTACDADAALARKAA